MTWLRSYFADLDAAWPGPQRDKPVTLRLIGSTALMLRTAHHRGTKDSDVLETAEVTGELKQQLRSLAGRGTELHRRHGIYLDVVSSGLPFLPQQPLWHPITLEDLRLEHFELVGLDVVDVVVNKLARLSASDLEDIQAMVALGKVPHDQLIARFRGAVDMFAYDARADDLPRFVRRLHQIERDLFDVDETEIELPHWI